MSEEIYESVKKSRKTIFANNFIGGIAWGLGVTFGLTIVIALITFLMKKVNLIPVVGNFVSQVYDFVLQNNPNLIK